MSRYIKNIAIKIQSIRKPLNIVQTLLLLFFDPVNTWTIIQQHEIIKYIVQKIKKQKISSYFDFIRDDLRLDRKRRNPHSTVQGGSLERNQEKPPLETRKRARVTLVGIGISEGALRRRSRDNKKSRASKRFLIVEEKE